jgi:hypothetical protein
MGKCYEIAFVFQFIEEIIETLCQQSGEAEHDAIVSELLKHPEASVIIEIAVAKCPERDPEWIAANMVAWMSQHYTTDRTDMLVFQQRFQRREHRGSWAYSLQPGEKPRVGRV